MSMKVSDRQLAHLVNVVAMVGGSRAHVADWRRAISVAVKPMDSQSIPYVLSCTLCVIHAHTLEARTVPVWLTLDTKCL